MKTAIGIVINCLNTKATLELIATAIEATASALECIAENLTNKEKINDR